MSEIHLFHNYANKTRIEILFGWDILSLDSIFKFHIPYQIDMLSLMIKICHCHSTMHITTHWGRVTHRCISKPTIIGSDNGWPPDRHQAIIWTNAGILLIRTLRTHFSQMLCEIHSFSFKKMHLKMSSAKGRPFSLGLIELAIHCIHDWSWFGTEDTLLWDL